MTPPQIVSHNDGTSAATLFTNPLILQHFAYLFWGDAFLINRNTLNSRPLANSQNLRGKPSLTFELFPSALAVKNFDNPRRGLRILITQTAHCEALA